MVHFIHIPLKPKRFVCVFVVCFTYFVWLQWNTADSHGCCLFSITQTGAAKHIKIQILQVRSIKAPGAVTWNSNDAALQQGNKILSSLSFFSMFLTCLRRKETNHFRSLDRRRYWRHSWRHCPHLPHHHHRLLHPQAPRGWRVSLHY